VSKVRGHSQYFGVTKFSSTERGWAIKGSLVMAPPINITADGDISSAFIQLNWEDTLTAAISNYYLFRADSLSGPFRQYSVIIPNATSFQDQDIFSNKIYYYKLKSFSMSLGFSDFSAVATNRLTPPAALIATDGEAMTKGAIKISWGVVGDADYYWVLRSATPAGNYREIDTTSALVYFDASLNKSGANNNVYYKAQAYSSQYGLGPFSNINSGYVSSTLGNISPPDSVWAVSGSGNINLNWLSVSNADSYYVYRGDYNFADSLYLIIGTVNDTTFNDFPSSPLKIYYYRIKTSHSIEGWSRFSDYTSGFRQ